MNQREIIELLGSWLAISVAFGWILRGVTPAATLAQSFLPALLISAVAVGTGFIFHELAHKYVAIHYGAHAEFFAWPTGLVIALLLAFGLGFIFAAPGAVYISAKRLSKKQNGIISLAGPAVNIALGIIFFGISMLMPPTQQFLIVLFTLAGYINFILAAFNLLPFGPLDGKKVFAWNPIIWAVFFIPMAAMYVLV